MVAFPGSHDPADIANTRGTRIAVLLAALLVAANRTTVAAAASGPPALRHRPESRALLTSNVALRQPCDPAPACISLVDGDNATSLPEEAFKAGGATQVDLNHTFKFQIFLNRPTFICILDLSVVRSTIGDHDSPCARMLEVTTWGVEDNGPLAARVARRPIRKHQLPVNPQASGASGLLKLELEIHEVVAAFTVEWSRSLGPVGSSLAGGDEACDELHIAEAAAIACPPLEGTVGQGDEVAAELPGASARDEAKEKISSTPARARSSVLQLRPAWARLRWK